MSDVHDLLATGKVGRAAGTSRSISGVRITIGFSLGGVLDCGVEASKGSSDYASISMNIALDCHGGRGLGTGISPAERDNLICSDAPVHLL